jgi:signal transduction histidine kinase
MTRSRRMDIQDARASQTGIEDVSHDGHQLPEAFEPRDSRPATVDGSFDHYALLVQRLLNVPTALVTILEAHRQVFPGAVGLAEPYRSARQTPLSHSFCKYVAVDGAPLLIEDARKDERVADNPAIAELDVIAYAGWPVVGCDGRVVGSVCAIDSTPRAWSEDDVAILEQLALACSAELCNASALAEDGEDLARTIFDSVDVAMAFYDDRGHLVLANDLARRWAKIAGFRLDGPDRAGSQVRRADNETLVPAEDQLIPRALKGDLADQEMLWVGPPGKQAALVASSHRVFRPDGTARGTLLAAHDVTDLARALQLRENFIPTVAHELLTPLSSLMGHVELLLHDVDGHDDDLERTAHKIHGAAVKLSNRMTELLDIADDRRKLHLRSTDLADLTYSVAATFTTQAAAARITLRTDAQRAEWALADGSRIEVAVRNVVSNAIKFTGRGGQVALLVHGNADHVRIAVTDNGVGMSHDEVTQACDTFWRAESTHRQAIPGTGVGLAIARDIVAAHHGSLTIDSTPGVGTTVTIALPRDLSQTTYSHPS